MVSGAVTNVFSLVNGLTRGTRSFPVRASATHPRSEAGQRAIWREYAPPKPAPRAVPTPASAPVFGSGAVGSVDVSPFATVVVPGTTVGSATVTGAVGAVKTAALELDSCS